MFGAKVCPSKLGLHRQKQVDKWGKRTVHDRSEKNAEKDSNHSAPTLNGQLTQKIVQNIKSFFLNHIPEETELSHANIFI